MSRHLVLPVRMLLLGVVPLACAQPTDDSRQQAAAAKPPSGVELIIPDENVGSWITLTSCLEKEHGKPGEGCEGITRMGLLFQLGQFVEADQAFKGITVKLNGKEVPLKDVPDTLTGGPYWINLVSQDAGTPLDSTRVTSLLPIPWRQLRRCDIPGLAECLREDKLHRGLTVQAILTCWPGDDGYHLDAHPTYGTRNSTNTLSFRLPGMHRLEIWEMRPSNKQVGPPHDVTFKLLHSGEAGTFDSIELNMKQAPPHHGGRHDPPWPPDDGSGGLTENPEADK